MISIKLVKRDWIFSSDNSYVFVGAGSKQPIPSHDQLEDTVQEGYFIGSAKVQYRSPLDLINSKVNPNPIGDGGQIILETKSLSNSYVCSGDSGGAFV